MGYKRPYCFGIMLCVCLRLDLKRLCQNLLVKIIQDLWIFKAFCLYLCLHLNFGLKRYILFRMNKLFKHYDMTVIASCLKFWLIMSVKLVKSFINKLSDYLNLTMLKIVLLIFGRIIDYVEKSIISFLGGILNLAKYWGKGEILIYYKYIGETCHALLHHCCHVWMCLYW